MTEEQIIENNAVKKQINPEQTDKLLKLFGALICYIIAFGLAFTPVWQLAFLAGIFGGAFYKEIKKGLLVGFIGVGLGWASYILVQIMKSSVMILINQVTGIILGNENLSWLIIILMIIIGAIIGMLGGIIGSGLRILIKIKQKQ